MASHVERGAMPGLVTLVSRRDEVHVEALGRMAADGGRPMARDTIFRIASMTKPVTSVALMQLIEQGKLALDEPVGKFLPELAKPRILEGFENGQPKLRPATTAITSRHLLTHTSGLAYDTWDKNLHDYLAKRGPNSAASPDGEILVFEPGTKWEYGTSVDKAGKLVEAISGLSLDDYFAQNIFQPVGMGDTYFNVPAEKYGRLVSVHQRGPDGSLRETPRQPPAKVTTFNGGGGLSSTASDYVKFMQMILRGGNAGKARILQAKTVAMMTRNQTGEIQAGRLTSVIPERSNNVDFHPGFSDRFGFGFLINPVAYEGGRSKGSLAWAGIDNTYFWIDPEKKIGAVILMQLLPFCDTEAMAVLRSFERAVYAGAAAQ
jgi:methyl acetate hydrolase